MDHRKPRRGKVAGTAAQLACAVALFNPAVANGQELEQALRTLASENARRYVRPVTQALAATMNAGFAYTAKTHEPLGFDVGVHVLVSRVAGSDLTFLPVLPDSVVVDGLVLRQPYGTDGSLESATALGSGDGIVLMPQNEYRDLLELQGVDPDRRALRFPGGFDFSAAPFAFVQAGVGVGLGTDAVLRFIPSLTLRDDIGSVSMLGFGLKHSLDQWLWKSPPVHLALFGNLHTLSTGDYADVSAWQVGLAASGDVALLTVVGALAYEDTRIRVDYVMRNPEDLPGRPPDGTRLSFEDGADRHFRASLGLALRLAAVRLSSGVSVGPYTTLDVGLILTYR